MTVFLTVFAPLGECLSNKLWVGNSSWKIVLWCCMRALWSILLDETVSVTALWLYLALKFYLDLYCLCVEGAWWSIKKDCCGSFTVLKRYNATLRYSRLLVILYFKRVYLSFLQIVEPLDLFKRLNVTLINFGHFVSFEYFKKTCMSMKIDMLVILTII